MDQFSSLYFSIFPLHMQNTGVMQESIKTYYQLQHRPDNIWEMHSNLYYVPFYKRILSFGLLTNCSTHAMQTCRTLS